jgi:hypothetical protein
MSDLDARCAEHGDERALDACQRCGTFFCGACLLLPRLFCGPCAEREGVAGPKGRLARWAIGIALGGLFPFFLPAGGVALVLGSIELARIEARRSPAAGRRLAEWAVILGWVELAFAILFFLFVGIVAYREELLR